MLNLPGMFENLRRWWSPELQLADAKDQNLVHVGLVDRRNYLGRDGVEVYLPRSKSLVIDMRPAAGESRRDPRQYVVKVLDQERWQIRTLVMRATQPLLVL